MSSGIRTFTQSTVERHMFVNKVFGIYGWPTEDVVFTVEYSVHCAIHAVYRLFDFGKTIPPIYHGLTDPRVGIQALESEFK